MITRSRKGATAVLVLIAALLILLPIGLFGFEVGRLNLATKQLKSATDSAALAAALFLSNASDSDLQKAKEMGLEFVKKNTVMSTLLQNTKISSSVDTDQLKTGEGSFDLLVDNTTGRVTAKAAFGLEPAFGGFLGLGTQTIRSDSIAGFSGLDGDVVICVDISDSMTLASRSTIARRVVDAKAKTVSYKVVRDARAVASLGRLGAKAAIPRLSEAKYELSPLFNAIKDKSDEIKAGAFIEAKRGNLENDAIFASSGAINGPLKGIVTPQAGWQRDYQKLGLQAVQPIADVKTAVSEFVGQINGNDNLHLGLVTFGGRNSEGPDAKDDFSTFKKHKYPHVALAKNENKQQLVVDTLGPSVTFNGTDMKGSIDEATKMLTSDQSRKLVPKTIILFTDGIPTTGSPKRKAKIAGEKGIRIYAIGFFTTRYSRNGRKILQAIVAAAGNGSKFYFPQESKEIITIFKQIGKGSISLINRD